MPDGTPLCLLLLPGVLEELAFADRGRDLLRAPAVVAVEPARWRARVLADAVAATQARRLDKHLPGVPRVVAILHPEQYRLARAVIARHRDCELWYGEAQAGGALAGRLADLDHLARRRAALVFDAGREPGRAPFQANGELWARLETLGVARR